MTFAKKVCDNTILVTVESDEALRVQKVLHIFCWQEWRRAENNGQFYWRLIDPLSAENLSDAFLLVVLVDSCACLVLGGACAHRGSVASAAVRPVLGHHHGRAPPTADTTSTVRNASACHR